MADTAGHTARQAFELEVHTPGPPKFPASDAMLLLGPSRDDVSTELLPPSGHR